MIVGLSTCPVTRVSSGSTPIRLASAPRGRGRNGGLAVNGTGLDLCCALPSARSRATVIVQLRPWHGPIPQRSVPRSWFISETPSRIFSRSVPAEISSQRQTIVLSSGSSADRPGGNATSIKGRGASVRWTFAAVSSVVIAATSTSVMSRSDKMAFATCLPCAIAVSAHPWYVTVMAR